MLNETLTHSATTAGIVDLGTIAMIAGAGLAFCLILFVMLVEHPRTPRV